MNFDEQNETKVSVSGIVDSIIYQNEENGYTVCELEDPSGDPVTVTGVIPYLTEGDKITVYGEWTNHPTYGRQFKAESYEKTLPAEEGDMLRYLASGAVKGIGPKTAQKIMERFGTDAFDVIENHADWLTDIPGITQKKAVAISEGFKKISGARSVMLFCRDFFTPQTAMKIYQKWGSAAVDRIRSNPYRLCEDFWGISFARADQIALSMGEEPDSYERILHGIVYILRNESVKSGHTAVPNADVIRCACDLLFEGNETYFDRIALAVEMGVKRGKIVREQKDDGVVLADAEINEAERYCAKKLLSLSRLCPKMSGRDAVLMIEKAEKGAGITYAKAQKEALYAAMEDGVMLLTGGPGTGKTTIIKGLISIFSSLDYDISLAAPTGRAAKRMSEATSYEAKTIHRLLEMDFSDESGTKFVRDENNTLDADVVIVDEASMIDVFLMRGLLKAVKNGSRLILIGDSDQLPSVGAGNILGDILLSGAFPTVRLTEIFRQSDESLIIENAHRINAGEMPDTARKDADFFFLPRESEESIAGTVVELVAKRLPKSYGADVVAKTQIITPSRKGYSGTDNLNHALQNALNPADGKKKQLTYRDLIFRVGDRVMQTKNNYMIEWTTEDGREGMGVYNGDIGTVRKVDEGERTVEVMFDERIAVLDSTMLEDLDHAYAITVHKSQGSEYPVVIIPLYSCAPMLLSRNLLYTAVTRAARMVILVGKRSVLETMVANNAHAVRITLLADYLKQERSD